jgi:hypothetical protein
MKNMQRCKERIYPLKSQNIINTRPIHLVFGDLCLSFVIQNRKLTPPPRAASAPHGIPAVTLTGFMQKH